MNADRVANRLPAETFDLVLGKAYPCRVSLARDPVTGVPVEIVLKPSGTVGRSGGSLDLIMFDLGVALSRALQGRDPATGAQESDLASNARAGSVGDRQSPITYWASRPDLRVPSEILAEALVISDALECGGIPADDLELILRAALYGFPKLVGVR